MKSREIGIIDKVVDELLEGYEETTPVAVIKKATWPDQQIIRGTLKDIAEKVKDANITKTAMIVVGDVLDPGEFNASKPHMTRTSNMNIVELGKTPSFFHDEIMSSQLFLKNSMKNKPSF